MIENTNTKQFYPGPILNNFLEITDFLFNNAEQIKITHSKLNEEGILIDVDLNYPSEYEVTKVLPSDINAAEAALTASTGQIRLKRVNVLAGEKLTVYRVSPIIQDKDYPRTGAFPAATHEGALDYLTMQNQEQQEELNRTLKVPISTGKFNAMVPVPLPNRILRIDEKATGFEFVPYDLDERLDTFEKDTNTTIAQNKQELLRLQDTFEANLEAETNTKIQEFEEEVNEKIQTVADAADKINTLDEDLAVATHAATEANKAATEANKAASTATNKVNEILSIEKRFLNNSQITNCSLEVPEMIKYTLANGVLTIKAGSILPVAMGTTNQIPNYPIGSTFKHENFKVVDYDFFNKKFVLYIQVQNDIVGSSAGTVTGNGNLLSINYVTNALTYNGSVACHAGSEKPTSGQLWYDTTNNILYTSDNSFETYANSNRTLPILEFERKNGVYTKINRVFNSLGFIGNSIWINKGRKISIPNGKNDDGINNNIELTTRFQIMSRDDTIHSHNIFITYGSNNILHDYPDFRYVKTYDEMFARSCAYYVSDDNKMYYRSAGTDQIAQIFVAVVGEFRATDSTAKSAIQGLEDCKSLDVISRQEMNSFRENSITKDYVSNCWTKIPQRIFYNLSNDNTLTIRKHTEVLYPAGTVASASATVEYKVGDIINNNFKVVDIIIVDNKKLFYRLKLISDISLKYSSTNTQPQLLCLAVATNGFYTVGFNQEYADSGITDYTGTGNHVRYRTDENLMKAYQGGNFVDRKLTLPLMILKGNGTQLYAHIMEVFDNGGCFGKITWVEENCEGLISHNIRQNGTPDSYKIKTKLSFYDCNTLTRYNTKFVVDTLYNTAVRTNSSYNSTSNRVYDFITTGYDRYLYNIPYATGDIINGYITRFHLVGCLNLMHYGAKQEISSWAFPSRKYEDWALGTSGATYRAPANGWLCLEKLNGNESVGLYIAMYNKTASYLQTEYRAVPGAEIIGRCYIPATKGDELQVHYDMTGQTNLFRFIYANSEVY